MSAILHVIKPGHRCKSPFNPRIRAEYIQAGERYQVGAWELWASLHAGQYVYIVCRADLTGDHYEFKNIDCASAKLAELGR